MMELARLAWSEASVGVDDLVGPLRSLGDTARRTLVEGAHGVVLMIIITSLRRRRPAVVFHALTLVLLGAHSLSEAGGRSPQGKLSLVVEKSSLVALMLVVTSYAFAGPQHHLS